MTDSCGSRSMTARATVRPPTPESKMPIGRGSIPRTIPQPPHPAWRIPSGPLEQLDRGLVAPGAGQARVTGDQRHAEGLAERDEGGVVGGQAMPQCPDPVGEG